MDLSELRLNIDKIDDEIIKLFVKRMALTHNVAEYKINNNIEVFQATRETEILDNIKSKVPNELCGSAETLFTTIMDISKSRQFNDFFSSKSNINYKEFKITDDMKIACPGTFGSYSEKAAFQISKNAQLTFFETFDEVFENVSNGTFPFGIVPIQNSSTGSVRSTYDLLNNNDLYVASSTRVKISHCLAVKNGTSESDIQFVYSHEQGLLQCSKYLKEKAFKSKEYFNTALAAKLVKESDENLACICSETCAKEHGLKILDTNISNAEENYTRFILIAKDIFCSNRANIVSVTLALPHTRSALYRLLTKFSVCGLNLLRLENKPIATKDFDAQFYLDFEGSILNKDVAVLISELKSELSYFKFLGNFFEV